MKINFARLPRFLLSFLLLLSVSARPVFGGCDGFGGAGGDCGGTVPPSGILVIPATFPDGQPVTSIAAGAFQGNDALTGLVIPNTVTNIGANAFASCRSLATITMGNGVTHIAERAFEWCLNLTNISFSTNVTTIGEQAFFQCSRLRELTIPRSVTYLGSSVFDACAALTNVVIPRGVTNIGESPFARCHSLTSIAVDSLNLSYSSLNGALMNRSRTLLIQCPGGKTGAFAVHNQVTNIGTGAFFGCTGLSAVTLPSGVRSIGDRAFLTCTLTSILLSSNLASIGDSAFKLSSLTNIVIPESVTNLGPRAFQSCGGLLHAESGNGVASIGDQAFESCWNMADVTLGANVSQIGERAFAGCLSLASITIPNRVTSIGNSAFEYCLGFTNVVIPSSVGSIGVSPFSYCFNLATINVDPVNSVYASVDGVLFTKNLTTLVQCPGAKVGSYAIPAGVMRIAEWALAICNNLTSITVPDSVIDIADLAFFGMNNVTNIIIGNSVASIGQEAFEGCQALQSIYFRGDVPSVGSAAFNFNTNAVFYLPGTIGWGSTFGGRPTALWLFPNPVILNNSPSFGPGPNGFGFIISWATNTTVVVEAHTQIGTLDWSEVATNTLADGWSYFSDSEWANHPSRFYRIRLR